MTMNRVIHGAVRRDLTRLTTALEQVPDGDRTRAAQLERAFANLHELLHHHHVGEDEHVWPWLAGTGADPELMAAMESEHGAMSEALAGTGAAMTAYARTGAAADAEAARASVVRTTEVVERHLRHEEDEVEPLLTPLLHTPGWKAVEKKLSRQPPGVAGVFFAWVTDGMDPAERSYFRATVPPPVVSVLSRTFGRRYHREIAPVWRR
jgi:hemerythrin-like domain-containing protein